MIIYNIFQSVIWKIFKKITSEFLKYYFSYLWHTYLLAVLIRGHFGLLSINEAYLIADLVRGVSDWLFISEAWSKPKSPTMRFDVVLFKLFSISMLVIILELKSSVSFSRIVEFFVQQ